MIRTAKVTQEHIMNLAQRLEQLTKDLDKAHEELTAAEEENDALTTEVMELRERVKLLDALKGAGVDSWEGWDIAHEIMENEDEEE